MGLPGTLRVFDRLRVFLVTPRIMQKNMTVALTVLALLTAVFWAMTLWSLFHMEQPLVRLMMPMTSAWTPSEVFAVWTMWSVMMAAMMLPSTAPMIATHSRVSAAKGGTQDTVFFALGYLVVWTSFSLVAAGLQWGLQGMSLLSHMLVLKSDGFAGMLLILAGIIQWSPLKDMCLTMCRTPVGFFTTHWRPGRSGALTMGIRHGAFCVGCCWALMALLFVFGVMNLVAIGLLTAVVAAEKLLPHGEKIAKAGGVVLIAWGAYLLVA